MGSPRLTGSFTLPWPSDSDDASRECVRSLAQQAEERKAEFLTPNSLRPCNLTATAGFGKAPVTRLPFGCIVFQAQIVRRASSPVIRGICGRGRPHYTHANNCYSREFPHLGFLPGEVAMVQRCYLTGEYAASQNLSWQGPLLSSGALIGRWRELRRFELGAA
jgi:hypothetical protein